MIHIWRFYLVFVIKSCKIKTWNEAGIVISCKNVHNFLKCTNTRQHIPTMHPEGFDWKSMPHYGEFDLTACQIPTIAPPMPKGGSGGTHYTQIFL